MSNGVGRITILMAGALALMTSGIPRSASAQILAVGGQVPVNRSVVEDHTWGIGARGQLGLPLIGVTLLGTADFYSPDCGNVGCEFQDASLNLLWSLPGIFAARPYFGAGVTIQKAGGGWSLEEGEDWGINDRGINFLAGIVLKGDSFRRFQPFMEAKYQAMQNYENQTVVSGGILLRVF